MARILTIGLLSLFLMLATACNPGPSVELLVPPSSSSSPSATNTPQTSANVATPSVTLVANLKSWLSRELSIPKLDISVSSSEATDWSDTCLGASQPDELCAQVVTPGYRLLINTPQGEYVVHSDRLGRSFRIAQVP
jgi:hypothetical protein